MADRRRVLAREQNPRHRSSSWPICTRSPVMPFAGPADFLRAHPPGVWDQGSLCAAHGDFQRISDTIAMRDGELPIADLLTSLRSAQLAAWEPPGGTAARFDIDLSNIQLVATDLDWRSGSGRAVSATAAQLISLTCHRNLPDDPLHRAGHS